MDAVGADHVGRAHAVAVLEPHVGVVAFGGDAGAAPAELDGVRLDRAHRIRQQAVQVAPVQHHMRRAVALARRRAEIEPVPGLAGAQCRITRRDGSTWTRFSASSRPSA